MDLRTDLILLTTILLVFTRLSALFLLTPLFSLAPVPARIRVLVLLALATVLVAVVPPAVMVSYPTIPALAGAMLSELVIGALMAFGLFAAFGVFLFGGRIIDFQMGFGVAKLIDPATNSQSPMLGTALNIMAVATFFLLDGHHLLMRGIVYSLEVLPPGRGLSQMSLGSIVAQFGLMFSYGLALVAPVSFTLLLLDVGLAVAARTMPQVNMFIVSLPLKILVGLTVLALSLNYLAPLLEKVFASIFIYWEVVLG
ncbi:MAG: flagellar biosynthetic protein FliR [Gammaproteobacteria bacterium]|nr:flagellar biosynthetic protein FliR [Gammaproteobacteria bacterium]